jgi:catalase-peroxidase
VERLLKIKEMHMKTGKSVALLAALAVATTPMLFMGPVHAGMEATTNDFWWPNRLDLSPLRAHAAESSPMGDGFDYAKAFASVDINALKADIAKEMTTS